MILYDHLSLIPGPDGEDLTVYSIYVVQYIPDGEDLTVQLQPPVLDELTPEVEYADGALAKYDQVRVQQYQTL